MARLLIWNPEADDFDVSDLPMTAQLPYVETLPLTAEAFFGAAGGEVAWTDRRALAALDRLCAEFSAPFSVDHAFCRAAVGKPFSLHATGTVFAVGRSLSEGERRRLFVTALRSGMFARVGMPYEAGDAVRLSMLCALPPLRAGDRGTAVCVLQEALIGKRLHRAALTGTFCRETQKATVRLQTAHGLRPTGIVDAGCWAAALH